MRGIKVALLLIFLVLFNGVLARAVMFEEEEEEERYRRREREEEEEPYRRRERREEEEPYGRRERKEERERERDDERFLLQDERHVFRTDAGEMRVVRGYGGKMIDRPMHIGFITMEPKTLFIPQYMDSSLILFIRRGEATVGSIYKDELVERRLRIGDVYRIAAGSTFYVVNTGEGQRLHIVCSIDLAESLGIGVLQSFFVGGGTRPASILSGFDRDTLATAFNVSTDELRDILSRQQRGPFVFLDDTHAPSMWAKFLKLKEEDRLRHLKRMVDPRGEPRKEDENGTTWSWRKLLKSFFGEENKKRDDRRKAEGPDSYNLYDRSPDFRNDYGWSIAVDQSDYSPLKHSGIGVYLVNLTAGTMMAPHVNPTATEYGIVLRGSGTIQIVYPNGTLAMNTKVNEGDVFVVPRYFPFCQIASRTGPFEFFGFTTSARKNRPQFLVGRNSVLQALRGPELAISFGFSEDDLRDFLDAQREAVILPTASVAPPDEVKNEKFEDKFEKIPKVMRSFGSDMIMGFD